MNRLLYCAVLFCTYISCVAFNLNNLQRMAYAIDDFDVPEVKQVLAVLSDDERTGLMHKKIAIIQYVGFAQTRHGVRLNRTPKEQIALLRSINLFDWNVKLCVIEALLLQHTL